MEDSLRRLPGSNSDRHSANLIFWAVVVLALLAVTACQPLIRPFQPAAKVVTARQLSDLGPRTGIVVIAPDLSGSAGQQFADYTAAALRDRDLPATAVGNPHLRYTLRVDISGREVTPRRHELLLRWRFVDPEGGIFASWDQLEVVDGLAWQSADLGLFAFLAGRGAEQLSNYVSAGGSDPIPTRPLVVTVWPVAGAPSDGGPLLTLALEAALRLRGVRITDNDDVDAFVIAGSVSITTEGDRQRVDLHWSLVRPDGDQIGSVDQSNTVPLGVVDGPWRDIAFAIADGAAEGLAALLITPEAMLVEPDL